MLNDANVLIQAKELIETKLMLAFIENNREAGFINDNWKNICARLEHSELHRMEEPPEVKPLTSLADPDLRFANGIVHAGTTLTSYRNGVNWANALNTDVDADSILAILTLYYIVDRAQKLYGGSKELIKLDTDSAKEVERGDIWQKIKKRIESHMLLES